MSQPQARSGVYAWDESDARSIASNTTPYQSPIFRGRPDNLQVSASSGSAISMTWRIVRAAIGRIRTVRPGEANAQG